MGIPLEEFKDFREHMKLYRDKDLAHLELRNISMIPAMEKALHSMAFYFHQLQAVKKDMGMNCHDKGLYDWFKIVYAKFERDKELAFGATGTPRGPNRPKHHR